MSSYGKHKRRQEFFNMLNNMNSDNTIFGIKQSWGKTLMPYGKHCPEVIRTVDSSTGKDLVVLTFLADKKVVFKHTYDVNTKDSHRSMKQDLLDAMKTQYSLFLMENEIE
jgi:hypothetical protein